MVEPYRAIFILLEETGSSYYRLLLHLEQFYITDRGLTTIKKL